MLRILSSISITPSMRRNLITTFIDMPFRIYCLKLLRTREKWIFLHMDKLDLEKHIPWKGFKPSLSTISAIKLINHSKYTLASMKSTSENCSIFWIQDSKWLYSKTRITMYKCKGSLNMKLIMLKNSKV